MPNYPTSNEQYTSTYYNQNECRSFAKNILTSVTRLSGVDNAAPWLGQPCSEVVLYNRAGNEIFVYVEDGNAGDAVAAGHRISLEDNEITTIRGLTNVNQVSAIAPSGTGTLYYRTQFFSSNPVR